MTLILKTFDKLTNINKKNKVKQSQDWFTVYKVEDDVFAIEEKVNDKIIISYFVEGLTKGILINTGTGIGDMKKLVSEIYPKPYYVMNTKTCLLHTGGNSQFSLIHVHNHKTAIDHLTYGHDTKDKEDFYLEEQPISDEKCTFTCVETNYLFDLGNKKLEVIAPSGYLGQGILLLDETCKKVFLGNVFEEIDSNKLSLSCMVSSVELAQKICKQYKDYTWYYTHSHCLEDKDKEDFIENVKDLHSYLNSYKFEEMFS